MTFELVIERRLIVNAESSEAAEEVTKNFIAGGQNYEGTSAKHGSFSIKAFPGAVKRSKETRLEGMATYAGNEFDQDGWE